MKIPRSIRDIYSLQYGAATRLQTKVDSVIKSFKKPNWHYESRVKAEQSFALKIETGRFPNPEKLEDFFGATIVVENNKSVDTAIKLAQDHFTLISRKPKVPSFTHKSPEEFPFDDLRLYLQLSPDPSLPLTGLEGITFELQIKTFLQHAWAIATHGLIYKTDSVSWAKQRIAYQVKAMLENAESSIHAADLLSENTDLKIENSDTQKLNLIIFFLKEKWQAESLPEDLRRLGQNIQSLLYEIRLELSELRMVLDTEEGQGRGVKLRNLSPFFVIIQSLINQNNGKMISFFQKDKPKYKIIVPPELEIPPAFENSAALIRIR